MSESKNRALDGAVLPTFLYFALSSMVGLVAITTSNLVDGVFVGNHVGSQALAAITLLVPCFTLLFAIALMFAIGGSVAAGKHIGAGDDRAASEVFSQTLIATFVMAVLFALASYGFEGQLYRLLSVPPELEPMVGEYFGPVRWVLIIQLTTMVLYYFVRADDHAVLASIALAVGAAGNIGLDALFIIEWNLGLRGAAWAIAISQFFQAAILGAYFFSDSRTLRFVRTQSSWKHLLQATYNGVSEFVNEISGGIVLWLLNYLLVQRLGVPGVAAFSVVNYYIFLSLMLSYGIADALHLLASQNYGARDRRRIQQVLLTALGSSLLLGAALSFSIVAWRGPVMGWFLTEEEASVAHGAVDLVLVIWPLFIINGTNIILSCYLTAIHLPRPSALIATMRGLVLPAGLLLALHWAMQGAAGPPAASQWSFLAALPLAEWTTFVLAVALCYRHRPAVLRF